jgi:hypothetical protein
MKLLLSFFIFATSIFASDSFEIGNDYVCFNTYTMKQGEKYTVKKEDSADKPFVFNLKEDKLVSAQNVTFDFKMQKGDMASYANEGYMLLLLKNNELGLVPKKARGQVQYFFQCKIK